MRTILVAVCCERCGKMIRPEEATRDKVGWLCRAHFSSTREAWHRWRARQAGEGKRV